MRLKIQYVWRQGLILQWLSPSHDWISLGYFQCSGVDARVITALIRYISREANVDLELEGEDKLIEWLKEPIA